MPANREPRRTRGRFLKHLWVLLWPVRAAVLRGLAVLLPPLVTVVIFIWGFQLIEAYLFEPVRAAARQAIVAGIADIREETDFWPEETQIPSDPLQRRNPVLGNVRYQLLPNGEYVPKGVFDRVLAAGIPRRQLTSGQQVYELYVDVVYLQPWKVALVFTCLFILVLYLLGKFFAAGIGRLVWARLESTFTRVPLVRTVYSAAKQVSDFLLSEHRIAASRVVAVQWPRPGCWALGFVTSEGMQTVEEAAGEEILTVLIATSPTPISGFTIQVRRKEVIELDIPLDEAFQFIISCGVVVPPSEVKRLSATKHATVEANSPTADDSLSSPNDQTTS